MNRRRFLALLSAATIEPAGWSAANAPRPATLDLREPLRLGVSCVVNRVDRAANYRPWIEVDIEEWKPVRLRHDIWDFGDMGGRFLEALVMARQMVSPSSQALSVERHMRGFVNSIFGPDGVIGNPDQKGPDHMFAQGSALYGLVTDFEASRNETIAARLRSFIDGLNRLAVQESDYLWFPQVGTKIAPCSHMAAYQVLPIVRFYELTRHAPALKYAERLSRWAFYHDPTFNDQGVITKTGWEGHLHAWMDTVSGIVRCTRAGGDLDGRAVLTRAQRLYDWVKVNYTSPFGWVADQVGSHTCETDTITGAIRLALELIKAGHYQYWNDVERFVRNQLVENQFLDVRRLRIPDPRVVRGLLGAFESYAFPNTLIAIQKGMMYGCCINGGMRALYLAYTNAIHETPEEIRVNLLLSVGTRALEVVSYLPYKGRLDLYPKDARKLLVRLPDWLRPEGVKLDAPSSVRFEPEKDKPYVAVYGHKPDALITLRFDQPEEEKNHVVAGKTYRVRWRGDTVLALNPPGEPYPIFQRQSLSTDRVPMKVSDIAYRIPTVYW